MDGLSANSGNSFGDTRPLTCGFRSILALPSLELDAPRFGACSKPFGGVSSFSWFLMSPDPPLAPCPALPFLIPYSWVFERSRPLR